MTAAEMDVVPVATEPPFFARVRLRTHRRALWMRRMRDHDGNLGNGLAISDAELDRILAGEDAARSAEQSFQRENPDARSLSNAIGDADESFAADGRWHRLREALGLSSEELDLLSLAASVDFDPWFRRACGYLHDDATINGATPWLAAQLFDHRSPIAAGPDSPLLTWRLAAPAEPAAHPWGPVNVWNADAQICGWLAGLPLTRGLDGVVRGDAGDEECLHSKELARMRAFVPSVRAPIEIALTGPRGSGRRTLAAQLCAQLGIPLFVAADSDIPAGDAALAVDRVIRVARAAKIAGGALCWTGCDDLSPQAWRALRSRCDLLFVACESAPPPAVHSARLTVELKPLPRSTREALWMRLTGAPPPAQIAAAALTPGEIAAGARVAAAGDEAVISVCTRSLHHDLPGLVTPLPLPWTHDDIVLQESVRRELAELEDQIRLRTDVYDDWGFDRLVPNGRAITAMFSGPSGTGKTMAAQVLARSTGLQCYRIDLSGVMNKYIGETEKHLKRLFDACERTDAILFFDEADALFGKRTQVHDAHDRFANIEIDYLLQRIEQFDGIAILATNRRGDLDSAFLRRIRMIIEFSLPGPAERLDLWRRALPERGPAGQELLEAIDPKLLAEKLLLTGAEIKSAALSAAFRARAEEQHIGMRHIVAAARRELAKRGALLRDADLGERT
jgi:ATP-dependent 26S proteasome regulatory subunit